MRDPQQTVDLVDRENLRQRPAALGGRYGGGRIDRRVSLHVEKLVELANRREPPGGGGRLQAALFEARHETAHGGGVGLVGGGPDLRQIRQVIGQIAPIGIERVARRAPLGRQHVQEQSGVESPRHGAARLIGWREMAAGGWG